MALFTLDIEKQLDAEFWTNRYIISAPDLQTATLVSATVLDLERLVHLVAVTFTKYRVADILPGTDLFNIVPINQPGQRGSVTTLLPLFNTIRVDFGVEQGRPSRKYLRGTLTENDIEFNTVSTVLRDFVLNTYALPLVAQGFYVDVDGQDITSASVFTDVQMRQLRRGSRRRTQPII